MFKLDNSIFYRFILYYFPKGSWTCHILFYKSSYTETTLFYKSSNTYPKAVLFFLSDSYPETTRAATLKLYSILLKQLLALHTTEKLCHFIMPYFYISCHKGILFYAKAINLKQSYSMYIGRLPSSRYHRMSELAEGSSSRWLEPGKQTCLADPPKRKSKSERPVDAVHVASVTFGKVGWSGMEWWVKNSSQY